MSGRRGAKREARRDAWAQALTLYYDAMRAEGKAPSTIRLYRYRLLDLAELYADPWQVTTTDLRAYLAREDWHPETRKSVRNSVRSFYSWAHDAGLIPADPSASLKAIRVPAGVPRPAPEGVLQAALAAAPPRERLMIALGAFAGLRASEIARVHREHLVGDLLRVRGKGGKTREVPLPAGLAESLAAWLAASPGGYAFPNAWGEAMTAGHVSKLVSRALPDEWTAHPLRHRYATTAYAGCRDLLAVGALLGHSRPETTQRYTRMPDDALRAAVGHVGDVAAPAPPPSLPTDLLGSEIELCASMLDARMVELDEQARATPGVRVDFRDVHAEIGARAAIVAGRPREADHFVRVVQAIVRDEVSVTAELVECRTVGCSQARVTLLEHVGTTCAGCGQPRARALGPVGDRECPPWCVGHPVQDAETLVHERQLVDEPGLLVGLEETWTRDDDGTVIVEGPVLVVSDDERQVRLMPDDAARLGAAITEARRLLVT